MSSMRTLLPASATDASYAPGVYYFTASPSSSNTGTLATGSLRLVPWIVRRTVTISHVGTEVTVVGDVGSKFRIGIYRDSGYGLPASLLVDAGQIAGDSATAQELAVSQTLAPGIYWIGGVTQAVTSTQPTLRTVPPTWIPPIPLQQGAAIPGAGAQAFGYQLTGVTGALPTTFTGTAISGVAPARIFVRTA